MKTLMVPCIRPNDPLFQVIQSQPIRPGADFHIFKHDVSAASAHWGGLNSGESSIPVSPEEDPSKKKSQITVFLEIWL